MPTVVLALAELVPSLSTRPHPRALLKALSALAFPRTNRSCTCLAWNVLPGSYSPANDVKMLQLLMMGGLTNQRSSGNDGVPTCPLMCAARAAEAHERAIDCNLDR